MLCTAGQSAAADFKVYYPNVTQGEFEIENRAFGTWDANPARTNERNFTTELGYGVTDYWFAEIENEFDKAPQDKWRYHALGLENVFQVTEPGEHYLDLGIFAEYEFAMQRGNSDGFQVGPILQKQFGRLLVTANLRHPASRAAVQLCARGQVPADPDVPAGLSAVRRPRRPQRLQPVLAAGQPGGTGDIRRPLYRAWQDQVRGRIPDRPDP
jgi:hypothetical protein